MVFRPGDAEIPLDETTGEPAREEGQRILIYILKLRFWQNRRAKLETNISCASLIKYHAAALTPSKYLGDALTSRS